LARLFIAHTNRSKTLAEAIRIIELGSNGKVAGPVDVAPLPTFIRAYLHGSETL